MTSLRSRVSRLFGLKRRFARNERGVTVIEFALLGLPFFSIIGAILETSLIFMSGQVLESAVQDIGRTIRTGEAQKSGVTLATFRQEVCDRLFGLFPDCAGLHIRVTQLSDFNSATLSLPLDPKCTGTCDWSVAENYAPGGGGSVQLIQVYYRYPVLLQFGPVGMANLANGTRLLGAATVFQNEPFT